jgi:neuronal calcium sensor 1
MSEKKGTPQLTSAEIQEIAEKSGVEEDIIRSWYKEFIQVCPTGKMNKKNFSKFYKILRGSTGEENFSKIAEYVFACFDKDGNGSLDFAEFIVAYSHTSIGDLRKKMEFIFLFYDKDKDGVINDIEFLKIIEAMYEYKGRSKKEYNFNFFYKFIPN